MPYTLFIFSRVVRSLTKRWKVVIINIKKSLQWLQKTGCIIREHILQGFVLKLKLSKTK